MTELRSKNAKDVTPASGVSQELDKFEMWFVDNSKRLVIASACIVVAAAIFSTVYFYVKGTEARNLKKFAAAKNSEELAKVLAENPAGAPAAAARYDLAQKAIADGKPAEAVQYMKAIADDTTLESYVRGRAALDAGYLQEKNAGNKDAAEFFRMVANGMEFPEDLRGEANFALGRVLAAEGDKDGAKAAFEQAITKEPKTQAAMTWSEFANNALNRLNASK